MAARCTETGVVDFARAMIYVFYSCVIASLAINIGVAYGASSGGFGCPFQSDFLCTLQPSDGPYS